MESKRINRLLDGVIYLLLIVFLSSSGFSDMPPPSGWYQQNMPDTVIGRQLWDVAFVDSLTGFAGTSASETLPGFILKTTNGGDNWFIIGTNTDPFDKIQFLNKDTGIISTYGKLFITTNQGSNWNILLIPDPIIIDDFYAFNLDTIWIVSGEPFFGGVYRTTNGGQNWSLIWNYPGENPTKIYMYNARIGFICNDVNHFYKTTDGGFNWELINNVYAFRDIYFLDNLTGYKVYGNVRKTTDGGYNWYQQTLPSSQQILNDIYELSVFNADSIWGIGGMIRLSPGFPLNLRGIIYRTTNGGINWGYQLPDTNIKIEGYNNIYFSGKYYGWAYGKEVNMSNIKGVHTTIGGSDTTIYTSVNNNISISNQNYELFQNYPNPFNSITNIKFKLKSGMPDFSLNSRFAEIKVYDITGKLIRVLTSKKYEAGEHIVRFDASGLPSGVYFYKLTAGEYNAVKKMVLLK